MTTPLLSHGFGPPGLRPASRRRPWCRPRGPPDSRPSSRPTSPAFTPTRCGLARKDGKGDPACWPAAPRRTRPSRRSSLTRPRSSPSDPAVVKAWAAGRALDLRPGQGPAAASRRGLCPARQPAGQRLHGVPGRPAAPGRPAPHVRAIANLYQTVLEVERDGDRLAGALRLLHRPRAARVRRPARPSRKRRGPPGRRAAARGQELRVARGLDRRGVADRGPQDLELGREEPAHPRRARPGQGASRRARRGRPRSRG